MADLDDFFAKKDRKKSKGKKFLTADELVKNLEDTSKREPAKPKKEPAPVVVPDPSVTSTVTNDNNDNVADQPTAPVNQKSSNDEEWKEFEVEERKDYSGLKIGQLTINDDEYTQQNYGEDTGYDEDEAESNELNQIFDLKGNGPWKKVVPAEEVVQITLPPAPAPANNSKVYISPAFRNSQAASAMRNTKVRKGAAPDITNEDYFPTLGAARPEEQKKKRNEPAFEEVRHGSRVQRVQEQVAAPVSVANRFQSLEDNDS